ncbi:MAG TPA: tetratricopeptide repeat protein [Candidatus Saccharimonadales bacterium]|jgi:tetratricopeptide (TPR) repeat protein|nr:tetratricopeptide repeat protein [Candidatus Saccharimonadales bacterium]
MKKNSILVVFAALLLALGTLPAWPQATLAKVEGKITDNGKPLPDVTVAWTSAANGKVIKMKTDKNGVYFGLGFVVGEYKFEVLSANGDLLYRLNKTQVTIENGANVVLNVDITKDSKGGGQPTMTAEQMEAIKAQNAKASDMNILITQAQNALTAKNWQEAIPPLKQMVEKEPAHWDYHQALGNAYFGLAQYQEAVDTYERGVAAAQATIADPKADAAKAKIGLGQMWAYQGNAYLKMKNTDMAVQSFTKAAEMDPNPAVAYFNICATQYNIGAMQAAAKACDKAIAADPNKADAYFIKGSALYGDGKLDANNKYVVPPGTTDALNKYLELAPDGGHAVDVRAMLEALGVKIETTFGTRKKK